MSCTSIIVSGAASLGIFLGLVFAIFFIVLTALRWIRCLRFDETSKRNITVTDLDCDYGWTTQRRSPSIQISPDATHAREFIENLVEKLIGGPLDGITLGKLSTHSSYLSIFEKYHGLLCGELAKLGFTLRLSAREDEDSQKNASNSLRLSLSRLIERIIREAVDLPNIKQILHYSRFPFNDKANNDAAEFSNKTYEDILATAILNKVIQNIQNSKEENKIYNVGLIGKETKDFKLIKNEIIDSEEDEWRDSNKSQPFSLTVEEHVEEVTTTFEASDYEDEDGDENDVLFGFPNGKIQFSESGNLPVTGDDDKSFETELVSSTNSWEENWLFQKKRFRSTPNVHHPVPVPMLVPNPSQEFKALVGGIDADDLSDISDSNDYSLEDLIEESPRLVTEIKILPEKVETADDENLEKEENPETGQPTIFDTIRESVIVENHERTSDETSDHRHRFHVDGKINEELSMAVDSRESEPLFGSLIAGRKNQKWENLVSSVDSHSLESLTNREDPNRNQYPGIRNYFKDPEGRSVESTSERNFQIGTNANSKITRDYYVNENRTRIAPSSNSSRIWKKDFPIRVETEQREPLPKDEKASDTREKDAEPYNKETKPIGGNPISNRFKLPNVKELAKNFAAGIHDEGRTTKDVCERKGGHGNSDSITDGAGRNEPEIDYSSVPVAEIILNLTNILKTTSGKEDQKMIPEEHISEKVKKEMFRNCLEKPTSGKFSGKRVHSLTARSISKEFREGLKRGSQIRIAKKNGECKSQETVLSPERSLTPTPSVDLKNMRKFWEDIIIANSTSHK